MRIPFRYLQLLILADLWFEDFLIDGLIPWEDLDLLWLWPSLGPEVFEGSIYGGKEIDFDFLVW